MFSLRKGMSVLLLRLNKEDTKKRKLFPTRFGTPTLLKFTPDCQYITVRSSYRDSKQRCNLWVLTHYSLMWPIGLRCTSRNAMMYITEYWCASRKAAPIWSTFSPTKIYLKKSRSNWFWIPRCNVKRCASSSNRSHQGDIGTMKDPLGTTRIPGLHRCLELSKK